MQPAGVDINPQPLERRCGQRQLGAVGLGLFRVVDAAENHELAAHQAGLLKRRLQAGPVHIENSAVQTQRVVEQLGFVADFVVPQRFGLVGFRPGQGADLHPARLKPFGRCGIDRRVLVHIVARGEQGREIVEGFGHAQGLSEAAAEARNVGKNVFLAVAPAQGQGQPFAERVVDLPEQRVNFRAAEGVFAVDKKALGEIEGAGRAYEGLGVDNALVGGVVNARIPLQTPCAGALHAKLLGHAVAGNAAKLLKEITAAAVDVAAQKKIRCHPAADAGNTQVGDLVIHARDGVFEIRAHGLRRVEIDPAAVARKKADTIRVGVSGTVAVAIGKSPVQQGAKGREHARGDALAHADGFIGVAVAEIQGQLRRRRPQHGAANVPVGGIVAAATRVDVVDIAVRAHVLDVDARGQPVLHDRDIDHALYIHGVETAVVEHRGALDAIGMRRLSHHRDTAAQRVGAEVGGLRAAQHFDARDVEQRRVDTAAGEIETVHVKTKRRGAARLVRVHEVGDPAHTDLAPRARAVADKARVRRARHKIAHVAKAVLFDIAGAERRDCDGHVLEAGLALLGGDHNLLQRPLLGLHRHQTRRAGQRRDSERPARRNAPRPAEPCLTTHIYSPHR